MVHHMEDSKNGAAPVNDYDNDADEELSLVSAGEKLVGGGAVGNQAGSMVGQATAEVCCSACCTVH